MELRGRARRNLSGALRCLFALALVLGLASCALAVAFDEYGLQGHRVEEVLGEAGPPSPTEAGTRDVDIPDGPRLYRVAGTVTGLGGKHAILRLNETPLEVGDGPFAFPSQLPDGARWAVTVQGPGTHACSLAGAAGTIAQKDGSGVVVSCFSREGSLSALTASIGDLSPAFASGTLAYTLRARRGGLFAPIVTTVTAATSAPDATITVQGASTLSGVPSAEIVLKPGVNPIDVAVTAPDHVTVVHYTLDIDVDVEDYVKASNTRAQARFGAAVAIDGDTLVVSATGDSSDSTGVNGDQASTAAPSSGAVYVFMRNAGTWSQQAYIKASNARTGGFFGSAVAIDGDTLVVGSSGESSSAVGVNGDQSNTSAPSAGAVYVFTRNAGIWSQQAYIKASNPRASALFGCSVKLAGTTLAVGSRGEKSAATGIDGNQADASLSAAGAVYVFTGGGVAWSQEAYVKPSNTRLNGTFGSALALEGDTLAVGGGVQGANDSAYIFARSAGIWSQQAELKGTAPTNQPRSFGATIALSGDTVAVGATQDGLPPAPLDPISMGSYGAVFVFTRSGTTWSQQAYVTASNRRAFSWFGSAVALAGDTLLVGANAESSGATGLDGNQADTSAASSGAAYLFRRGGAVWSQAHYIKAPNTRASAAFGVSAAMSGASVVVGAPQETSSATGVDGNASLTGTTAAGAVYVY